MKRIIKISIISSLSFSLPIISLVFPQKIRVFIFEDIGAIFQATDVIMRYTHIYLILSIVLFILSIITGILYFILKERIFFKISVFSIIFSSIQFITLIIVGIYILANSQSS
ncbi:MAG: hypothetical protein FWG57_08505 [Endomicrobia bacterium]|nr:hypothetical protein [Endomicrobiia bacterium]